MNKKLTILLLLLTFRFTVIAQDSLLLQKSWIKTKIENLSKKKMEADTGYIRYTFDQSKVYISFSPAWDEYNQPWKLNGKRLSLGYDTYDIVELTDTSLVLKIDGFRENSFLSESYLANNPKNLNVVGVFEGKALYQANKFISPRYAKGVSFKKALQLDAHDIPKEIQFLLTFVVDEQGKIKNIKLIKGLDSEYDKEFVTRLQRSSGFWTPAYYQEKPIQTEFTYKVKFKQTVYRIIRN